MAKYNAFLDIVKECPDWTIKKKPVCPFCKSKNVEHGGASMTLVGGKYNHLWTHCKCKKCNQEFTLEEKERGLTKRVMRWYTQKGKILRGIPGCFESYIYTCSKCGGEVHRTQLKLDSDEEATILSSGPDLNGVWKNNYRTIFRCDRCKVQVESENDHYDPHPPKEMTYEEKVGAAKKNAGKNKLRLGWKIYEEPGICIINDYAINDYAIARVETSKE
jgi:hypothetical protein